MEIKRPILPVWISDDTERPEELVYLIRDEHSVADVVRYCIEQTSISEVLMIIKKEAEDAQI